MTLRMLFNTEIFKYESVFIDFLMEYMYRCGDVGVRGIDSGGGLGGNKGSDNVVGGNKGSDKGSDNNISNIGNNNLSNTNQHSNQHTNTITSVIGYMIDCKTYLIMYCDSTVNSKWIRFINDILNDRVCISSSGVGVRGVGDGGVSNNNISNSSISVSNISNSSISNISNNPSTTNISNNPSTNNTSNNNNTSITNTPTNTNTNTPTTTPTPKISLHLKVKCVKMLYYYKEDKKKLFKNKELNISLINLYNSINRMEQTFYDKYSVRYYISRILREEEYYDVGVRFVSYMIGDLEHLLCEGFNAIISIKRSEGNSSVVGGVDGSSGGGSNISSSNISNNSNNRGSSNNNNIPSTNNTNNPSTNNPSTTNPSSTNNNPSITNNNTNNNNTRDTFVARSCFVYALECLYFILFLIRWN
ncbi:hypothetical protein CWI39_3083p0010, partial [Hamiltosporidium magnivora]